MARTGYSYIRFSAKKQERGDSIRRQTELRDAWLTRHPDVQLDESLRADLGRSAFKGKKQKALLAFIERIERGEIRPGSILIVEALHRVSRLGVDEGYDLLKRILRAGIWIVTLAPEREYGPDAVKGLMKGALELQFYLEAAHEYSLTISRHVGASYVKRRQNARAGDGLSANVLPAWCMWSHVSPQVILDHPKAEAVRRVFELATAGYGAGQIVRRLTAEHVPAIGKRATWQRGYVLKLIRDRRVLGEYRPTAGGKPTGEVINVLPRVIEDKAFNLARAGAADRKHHGGRPSKECVTNLFVGIVRNALTGENMILQHNANRSGPRTAVLADGGFGRNRWQSFPYWPFERLVRARLRELDPTKVLAKGDRVGDELRALEAERDEVRRQLAEIADLLADRGGKAATLALAADRLEERERELNQSIDAAAARASRPLLPAWKEAHKLLATEEAGPNREEVRLRLRSVLCGIIDRVTVLVVPRGVVRLAAVQLDFREGGRRHYVLYHRRQYFNFKETVPAFEDVKSFTDTTPDEERDLRNHEYVQRIQRALAEVPLD